MNPYNNSNLYPTFPEFVQFVLDKAKVGLAKVIVKTNQI